MDSNNLKYDLAIVVVTYNQESIVLETLESIKYQIIENNYRGTVQVIVADDGSRDKTQYYVSKWFEENASLFADTKLLMSHENRGTSANFANAMNYVTAKHFYSIAGDDLFSPEKVFEIIEKYDAITIARDVPYVFQDYCVKRGKRYYFSSVCNYFQKRINVYLNSQVKCPFVNGTIVGIDLLTDSVLSFSKQVRLLDDQGRYLKMFEENDKINIVNEYIPIILYRLSDNQVTNKEGAFRSFIVNDKRFLCKYVLGRKRAWYICVAAVYEFLKIQYPYIFSKIILLDNSAYRYVFNKLALSKRTNNILNQLLDRERINSIDLYLGEINSINKKNMENYGYTIFEQE